MVLKTCSLKVYPQEIHQEGGIAFKDTCKFIFFIFGLTCNFTITELLQHDIVFNAVERLKILEG